MASNDWEPVLDGRASRAPTKNCLTRIRKDLKELMKHPLQGIYCVQDDTIATLLHAVIMGPFDTPYVCLKVPSHFDLEDQHCLCHSVTA